MISKTGNRSLAQNLSGGAAGKVDGGKMGIEEWDDDDDVPDALEDVVEILLNGLRDRVSNVFHSFLSISS